MQQPLCSPMPNSSAALTELITQYAIANATLLKWSFPKLHGVIDQRVQDVRHNWAPFAGSGCHIANDCYCFHVQGDGSSSKNPDGWRRCARHSRVENCKLPSINQKRCACFSGSPCLFSDMKPTKILSAVSAARAAGVTHIIEEGRFGGLSAYMYAVHGFKVTSIEFLPLDGPTEALQVWVPGMRLLTGDGSALVPSVVANMSDAEAARTMVIFDGEKRFDAWPTWKQVQTRVAIGIFDDTNFDPSFDRMLAKKGYRWFSTSDSGFREAVGKSGYAESGITQAFANRHLRNATRPFYGGCEKLQRFEFTIVQGEGWGKRKCSGETSED